jgi:hypothetical protein
VAGIASWVERRPEVLIWRLATSLRTEEFPATTRSEFSGLSRLIAVGERPFSRISLEQQLVEKISSAIGDGQYCVIVGGPGGIGKSVFWEKLLKQRHLHKKQGVWDSLPGPTRVVELLKCTDLAAFEAQIIDTFVPKPYFPSFGLSASPTYTMALEILAGALQVAAMQDRYAPLILYVEDVNRLASFPGWQDRFVPLASVIASSGNGIIVGNSSALLAYRKFEELPHTGMRTSRFFFPSLPSMSEELAEFLRNGGHLYQQGYLMPPSPLVSLIGQSDVWNGNLVMLKHGTREDVRALRIRIGLCLTVVNTFGDSRWKELVDDEMQPQQILDLRMGLLQLIADTPGHEILLDNVPVLMQQHKIVEQLAALDLLTFRTLESKEVVVAPYYPAVIQQFKVFFEAQKTARF